MRAYCSRSTKGITSSREIRRCKIYICRSFIAATEASPNYHPTQRWSHKKPSERQHASKACSAVSETNGWTLPIVYNVSHFKSESHSTHTNQETTAHFTTAQHTYASSTHTSIARARENDSFRLNLEKSSSLTWSLPGAIRIHCRCVPCAGYGNGFTR